MMKKIILLAILLLVPYATSQPAGTTIFFDKYHSALGIEERLNLLTSMLRDNGYNVSFNYSEITSDLLAGVDILVVALPTTKFSDAEKGALLDFVIKGGGLLLIGDSKSVAEEFGILVPLNDIATTFGITFSDDMVVDENHCLTLNESLVPELPIISDMVSHPVTLSVKQFFLGAGCSLTVSPPAFKLAFGSGSSFGDRNNNGKKDAEEEAGVVVLAGSEYGDGRVVAIGDSHLWGSRETSTLPYEKDQIDYLDNRKLARNIFFWLASKPYLESVASLVGESQQLLDDGNFVEAKNKLTTALSMLARIGSQQHLKEINTLLEKSEKGIRADNLMKSAEKALGEKRYSDARADFVSARDVYAEIESPREKEASEKIKFIDSITKKDERRNDADTLFEKGIGEFNKGNCKDAQEYFRQAKAVYIEVGDTQKANLCTDYIQKCEKKKLGWSLLSFIFGFLFFWRIHRYS